MLGLNADGAEDMVKALMKVEIDKVMSKYKVLPKIDQYIYDMFFAHHKYINFINWGGKTLTTNRDKDILQMDFSLDKIVKGEWTESTYYIYIYFKREQSEAVNKFLDKSFGKCVYKDRAKIYKFHHFEDSSKTFEIKFISREAIGMNPPLDCIVIDMGDTWDNPYPRGCVVHLFKRFCLLIQLLKVAET